MREPMNPYDRIAVSGPPEGCDCEDPDTIAERVREEEIDPLLTHLDRIFHDLMHHLRDIERARGWMPDSLAVLLRELGDAIGGESPFHRPVCWKCSKPMSCLETTCLQCRAMRPESDFLWPMDYVAACADRKAKVALNSPTPRGGDGAALTAAPEGER